MKFEIGQAVGLKDSGTELGVVHDLMCIRGITYITIRVDPEILLMPSGEPVFLTKEDWQIEAFDPLAIDWDAELEGCCDFTG
ncbi:hypothetical protein N9937_00725 [bacterium]|nr:hypothetical protein [bacterium]